VINREDGNYGTDRELGRNSGMRSNRERCRGEEMTFFPLLLIMTPIVVVALLALCFGQKGERKPALFIVAIIASLLLDYLIWWLNHPASHSN
jgi:hypothetical protein